MIQEPVPIVTALPFLNGGGEMGALMRSYNWLGNNLGSPIHWPQSLKTTVSIILNSKFPMFLWWGPDLICLYNDAYRPSLGINGKHPNILGMAAKDAWPEIWETIHPLIDQVIKGGEATWSEDQLIPIYRNGRLEDVYWTFSYSPVIDESEKPGGVIVTCNETTQRVNRFNKIAGSEAKFRNILDQAPVAIAVFNGPNYVIDIYNDKVLEYWGRTAAQVKNKPLFEAVPEASGQGFEELLYKVYTTGESFVANELPVIIKRNNILVTTWINFIYEPIRNSHGKITGIIVVCTEVTEQVNARKELEKVQDMLNLAITSAGAGTWRTNLATDELFASKLTRSLHGIHDSRSMTFADALQMVSPNHREKVQLAITKAVTNGRPYVIEYLMHPIGGSKARWLRSSGKAYYNATGTPLYVTGIVSDITEQKEDDIRKSDFIGMVSHELKTPLTSLSANLQMMQLKAKKTEDERLSASLLQANKQVKKMTNMINGFLNISRLESGKMHLLKERFDIAELLVETIEDNRALLTGQSINFLPIEGVIIYADRDKIGSVISNLLSNAVKYATNNKVIHIKCEKRSESIVVSFKDEGIGIDVANIQKLFDRYYRVENAELKHVSGFGIGLYLCAEIIQQHNGTIWVESLIGLGATFYFELPLEIE